VNHLYNILFSLIVILSIFTSIPIKANSLSNSKTSLLKAKSANFKNNELVQDPEIRTTDTQSQVKIRVKHFIFIGNTVIGTNELNLITNKYLNEDVTLKELILARDAVTKLYRDKGYSTSKAKLLPLPANQNLSIAGADITIQVFEGKVEQIIYQGSPRLRRYVVFRLKAATSPVMNENKLIEALRILQNDKLINQISARQYPGSHSSSSILTVKVKENNPVSVTISLNNGRSPAIGQYERGIAIEDINLLGNGDTIKASFYNTDGSNKEVFSYTSPFNSANGTIGFSFNNFDSTIIEKPASLLDINTVSRSYDLTIRQPLFHNVKEKSSKEFAIGLTLSREEAQSAILGTPFPISPGSDVNGSTRLIVLRPFQEYLQRNNTDAFYLKSQFNIGLGILDANINSTGPDGRFITWQGTADWQHLLPYGFILNWHSMLQVAGSSVPSLEQITIGGSTTVRGYRENGLIDENGMIASVEILYPIFNKSFGSVLVGPFIDTGVTWGNLLSPSSQIISSVGIKTELNFNEKLSARFNAAFPIVTLSAPEQAWLGNTLSFQINLKF
jgi:hemolysin activation/secretion protein